MEKLIFAPSKRGNVRQAFSSKGPPPRELMTAGICRIFVATRNRVDVNQGDVSRRRKY
jgi:hypothetical protein